MCKYMQKPTRYNVRAAIVCRWMCYDVCYLMFELCAKKTMCKNGCEEFLALLRAPEMRQMGCLLGWGLRLWGTGLANTNVALKRSL